MSLVECHPKTRQATVSQAQEVTNLHQHHCTVHCAVLAYNLHQHHSSALCCDAGVQVATDPLQK